MIVFGEGLTAQDRIDAGLDTAAPPELHLGLGVPLTLTLFGGAIYLVVRAFRKKRR